MIFNFGFQRKINSFNLGLSNKFLNNLNRVFRRQYILKSINKDLNINYVYSKCFSEKDDKFWEEYEKMKKQGGKYPALEGKYMIYNKTVHSWKYSNKHALTSDEFFDCLRSLNKGDVIPYLILDIRERNEIEYELPKKTRKSVEIPIIYRQISEINNGNYEDLQINKYIICIDSSGEEARNVSRMLFQEGYLSMYVHGGYEMFLFFLQNKEF